MSTLRVDTIQFNQDGNATISATNTYNVTISIDGDEKVKFDSNGLNLRSAIRVNNSVIIDGNGSFANIQSIYSAFPVGSVQAFSNYTNISSTLGDKWIKCDGSVYNQSAYPELYSAVGLIPNDMNKMELRKTDTGLNKSAYFTSALYANNIFLAAGPYTGNTVNNSALDGAYLYTSTDSFTWTLRTTGLNISSGMIRTLAYGNGLYVLGGANGSSTTGTNTAEIRTSANGITWTNRTTNMPTNNVVNKIIYANGIFVAASDGGRITTSTDGITWNIANQVQGSAALRKINALTYGNGIFVYGTDGRGIGTSTDCVTWTTSSTSLANVLPAATATVNTLFFKDGKFFLGSYDSVGSVGVLATSTDCNTWTRLDIDSPIGRGEVNVITYDEYSKMYMLAGNSIFRMSPDGINWKQTQLYNNTTNFNVYDLSANDTYDLAISNTVIITAGIYNGSYSTLGAIYAINKLKYSAATEFITPTIESETTTNLDYYIKAQ